MKVAFIIQDMFARGAQYVTARMVEGFVKCGYDVDLIVSQYHNKLLSEGNANSFIVPEKTNWIFLGNLHARQNLLEIRRYLANTDAMAVFSMSTGYTQALRVASIGLRKKPKLVHVEHFLAGYDDYGRKAASPAKFSSCALFRRWYWAGFDRVFSITRDGVDDFVRMNPWYPRGNVRIVNNPAIGENFWQRINSPAEHSWLENASDEWRTFVAADAFVESKGHKFLIEAAKELARRGVKVRILLFGHGALEPEYRRAIGKYRLERYFALGGYTMNLPAQLARAHGHVKSSLIESFGITLVEALAAGCRVVSFDCPFGPREILEGGKYGTLVPTGDANSLADAMVCAAQKRRGVNPLESWNRYTVEATVDKYLAGLE